MQTLQNSATADFTFELLRCLYLIFPSCGSTNANEKPGRERVGDIAGLTESNQRQATSQKDEWECVV